MSTGTISITDAYAVSPTVLALRIETGKVVRGQQFPYVPQPGDYLSEWDTLYRNNKIAGHLVANNSVFRTPDQLIGPKLDTAWADRTSSYTLRPSSGLQPAIAPKRVFRKSKIGNMVETLGWRFDWAMEHTVFLELPQPLRVGETYAIDFSGDKVEDTTFVYDPAGDRSEAVHVSHTGFAPSDPAKVAFLSTWMGPVGQGLDYAAGQRFWLLDERGQRVYTGAVELSKDKDSFEDSRGFNYNGTDVYMMDFSDFSIPGTYRVLVDGVGTSFPFDISTQTWADSFYVSARGMYHQRSGIALQAPYTDYARPRPFHPDDGVKVYQSTATLMDTFMGLNPEVDTFSALVAGKTETLVPAAWGGWFDAGDWDRRIQHLDVTRALLELAELFPDYFDGVSLNIPESQNTLPDVIDEALWGLDFFKRLQLPNGAVRGGVESAEHPKLFEASWQESQEIFVYAPDMWSSYKYAATAAYAAHVLRDIAPAKASAYANSARRAMAWAEAEFAKTGSAYTEVHDERNLAAAELYRLTGSANWHQIFLDTTVFDDAEARPYVWRSHNHRDAAYTYARTAQPGVDPTVQTNARSAIIRAADEEIAAIDNTGFKWNKDPWAPLGWGTGLGVVNTQTLLRAHTFVPAEKYIASSILAAQFSLGANPDNISYTTGLGYRTPDSPLHADSRATGSAPPPGLTLYGPYGFEEGSHWSTGLFNPVMFPQAEDWPAAEGHFDTYWFVPHSEFTVMQTMGPMAYGLGYLAAATGTAGEAIAEYGTLSLDHSWQTVSLKNTYTNPVVIVSDPTLNDTSPAAPRLRQVAANSFQVRLQEPVYADGVHAKEAVSYLVVEAGDWTLADGTRLSAGTHSSNRLTSKGFDRVDLTGFDTVPTVLTQVQTFNESDWVTTRTRKPSARGFQLAMQEEEARNRGGHAIETLGWVAFDPGATVPDPLLQGGSTPASYTHRPATVSFATEFDTAPVLIAKLGSYFGSDPANLRIDAITATGFGALSHEEQSLDKEMIHAPESVAFLALQAGAGVLTGTRV